MDDIALRIACLKAASRLAGSPAEVLRIALAFECYAIGGYNLGASMLQTGSMPLSEPAPATSVSSAAPASEPDPIDRHLDAMERSPAEPAQSEVPLKDVFPIDKLH
jgi:hypothetical protein